MGAHTQPLTEARAGEPLPAPPRLAAGCALYLDFDGTLVELAAHPDQVVVLEHLPGLLEMLVDYLDGAVAVITGRWLADVDGMLAPLVLPGAGLHGAELRETDTARLQVRAVPGLSALARTLRDEFAADARLLIEDKGTGVALHFRQAPERAAECIQRLRSLAAERPWLEVMTGNMVVEARTRGANKGYALRRLSGEPAFAGRMPVFVGDDRSDEDAFAVAGDLGGYGVKVGEGATLARYRCGGVADVHSWLAASVDQGRARG